MKIVSPSCVILTPIYREKILRDIEYIGRVCYKSEDKITEDSAKRFVKCLVKSGHHSVIEHVSLTVKFIIDRGVSHELVRHRLASYSQSSTRYCNYSKGKYGSEITVIEPCFYKKESDEYICWYSSCLIAEKKYMSLINRGSKAEEARDVLPNSLKTEIVMTTNLREWRHVLNLRCGKAAHPQIREIMNPLLVKFYDELPEIFGDIYDKRKKDIKQWNDKYLV